MGHNFKNGKWSDPAVPKRDWYCVHGYDRGRDNLEFCDMCESASVRYVHVMRHDDYPGELDVGCICAGHMEQDVEGAKRREADVRNRSARRAKWLHRDGWHVSAKGNPTIKTKGCRVTVFRSGAIWKWLLVWHVRDDYYDSWTEKKMFSPVTYMNLDDAKLGAFDALHPPAKGTTL